MRCDVFAAWSWLLPLNVSVLTTLTPCEPPLRPLLRGREGAVARTASHGVSEPQRGGKWGGRQLDPERARSRVEPTNRRSLPPAATG